MRIDQSPVLVCVMVLARVIVLAHVMVLAFVMVLARVMSSSRDSKRCPTQCQQGPTFLTTLRPNLFEDLSYLIDVLCFWLNFDNSLLLE